MNTTEDPKVYQSKVFSKIKAAGKKITNREFIKCKFKDCDFSKADLSDNDYESCEFNQCNFTMTIMESVGLSSCTFVNCKLMGVDFTRCNSFRFSFNFHECFLDYSIFVGTKMKKTIFSHCSLKETNFSNTDLTLASFDNCDLEGTVFSHTILIGVDFRTAKNFSIDPNYNKMKRAKFSSVNLAGLLDQHQLNIE
ncbi:pentapeptide repeat-containing protein [Fulvivirga maritima]|uniref:pentapeptide repeat-containing protein n=1 Tax=Fulvivirga maritima TaxID=2904247 RepID=UPI001F395751|nr:pentapeptide repeat-containing protein [Fulvivirga maritima]UII26604.1 pentapeptide repeat-containing protein [Fulvivirga maritima]